MNQETLKLPPQDRDLQKIFKSLALKVLFGNLGRGEHGFESVLGHLG